MKISLYLAVIIEPFIIFINYKYQIIESTIKFLVEHNALTHDHVQQIQINADIETRAETIEHAIHQWESGYCIGDADEAQLLKLAIELGHKDLDALFDDMNSTLASNIEAAYENAINEWDSCVETTIGDETFYFATSLENALKENSELCFEGEHYTALPLLKKYSLQKCEPIIEEYLKEKLCRIEPQGGTYYIDRRTASCWFEQKNNYTPDNDYDYDTPIYSCNNHETNYLNHTDLVAECDFRTIADNLGIEKNEPRKWGSMDYDERLQWVIAKADETNIEQYNALMLSEAISNIIADIEW
jgi:hypothetical protein